MPLSSRISCSVFMRTPAFLVLLFLLAVTPCGALADEERVLFVGNSLTYVGNLPAVFSELAKETGAKVVLLGTYQFQPDASLRLVEHEAAAAQEVGIPYIEVSLKLWQLRGVAPELTWLADDGMHPGKDLVLLDALLVYQALIGSLPRPEHSQGVHLRKHQQSHGGS